MYIMYIICLRISIYYYYYYYDCMTHGEKYKNIYIVNTTFHPRKIYIPIRIVTTNKTFVIFNIS